MPKEILEQNVGIHAIMLGLICLVKTYNFEYNNCHLDHNLGYCKRTSYDVLKEILEQTFGILAIMWGVMWLVKTYNFEYNNCQLDHCKV